MIVPMRVGVNSLALNPAAAGGVWTYTYEIMREMPALDPSVNYTLYTNLENATAFAVGNLPNVRTAPCRVTLTRRIPRFAYEWGYLPVRAWARNTDVLFSPFFTTPLRLGYRAILTIHDVLYKDDPALFPSLEQTAFNALFDRTVAGAAHILTVSEYMKRRIMQVYRLPPDRVTVTPLAPATRYFARVGDAAIARVRDKYGIPPHPYILSVAALRPHKNLDVLIDAVAALHRGHRDHPDGARPIPLVLAGLPHTAAEPLAVRVRALGLEKQIILTGWVADEDLPALYQGTAVFVLPSRYEGFGLPVLEAMASEAPVITTRATALPEVAGEAAVLVEADDRGALVEALARVMGDAGLRRELVGRGRERARQFTWRTTAQATLAVLARVARDACTS